MTGSTTQQVTTTRLTPRQRVSVWLFFGVVLTLLPLILDWLRRLDSDRPHGLVAICANGELLLISAVIAGGAIGELVLTNIDRRWLSFKIWGVGSTIVMLAVEAGWYSDVASRVGTTTAAKASTVAYGSMIAFVLTVVASGACLYISSTGSET